MHLRSVKLGRDYGDIIEVVDGLSTNDRVIDNPPPAVKKHHPTTALVAAQPGNQPPPRVFFRPSGRTPLSAKIKKSKVGFIQRFLKGEHIDSFVMDRAGLPDLPDTSAPQYAKARDLMTAAWADESKIYLLTGRNRTVLQKILQNA